MTYSAFAGGVALTIFGVRFFRKGLDRLFGSKLAAWLSHLTENRWKAFLSGIGAGTVAPSSTALALISLQMLNAGKMSSERMLAVLLGANVGLTVTVHLLAFRIQDYAGLFICGGVIAFQFLRREVLRGVGQCILALGFIFLAMQLIGIAAQAWKAAPETAAWLRLLEGHPLLLMVFVALLTFGLQSSTASIGLALAFASSGLLSTPMILPGVIGANFGVSITAMVAGWKSIEGRRLSFANFLAKAAIGVPLLLLSPLFPWAAGTTSIARDIALFHTGFNLMAGLFVLPILGPWMALVRWLVAAPPPAEEFGAPASYLDPQALETPSLALANATRETLLMADSVKVMMNHFWKGYVERNHTLARRVQQEDDLVDDRYKRIRNYLNRLREGMTEEEARWQFALLTFSTELEAIGDVIDKNLCDALQKLLIDEAVLVREDDAVLAELKERVQRRFDIAVGLLATRDAQTAQVFIGGKEALNEWCRTAQRAHYEQLKRSGSASVGASAYFLEMLNSLRRINSHLSAIGYSFPAGDADDNRATWSGATDSGRQPRTGRSNLNSVPYPPDKQRA